MPDDRFYWACKNPECGAVNWKSRSSIEKSKENHEPVILRCLNCGYIHAPDGWRPTKVESDTWLPCIAFEGSELRLTLGPADPTGSSWKDGNGVVFTHSEYMKEYKIDPRVNWDWRTKRRKERPKNRIKIPQIE